MPRHASRRLNPSDIHTYTALKTLYATSHAPVRAKALIHLLPQHRPTTVRDALQRLTQMGAVTVGTVDAVLAWTPVEAVGDALLSNTTLLQAA